MADFPDRQPNESAKAHAAFIEYCSMGVGRSCEKVAEKCSKSVGLLYRWSAQHAWVERSKHYDAALSSEVAKYNH